MKKEQFAEIFTRLIEKRASFLLILGAVLMVLSILSAQNIRIVTQAKDILPQGNPAVQSYNRISDEFESTANLILTIEGGSKEMMIEGAEYVAETLRTDPTAMKLIRSINLKPDISFLEQWGLMMQKPADVKKTSKIFSEVNLVSLLRNYNDSLEATYIDNSDSEDELDSPIEEAEMVNMLSQMDTFMVDFRNYLENPASFPVDEQAVRMAYTFAFGEMYSFDQEGSMLLLTVLPLFPLDDIPSGGLLMEKVEEIFNKAEEEFPHLTFGYTGDVGQNYDEMKAINIDLLLPSLIAIAVIFLLFLFSFKRLTSVLFAFAALLIGIVLDVGIIGITIREINMVTSTFAVVLIGLGIDFGIHFISNYFRNLSINSSRTDALYETYKNTGTAIIFGALTTAAAFYVLIFSGTKAVAQFGLVAGTGILTTLAAMLLFLPSFLYLFAGQKKEKKAGILIPYRFLGSIGQWSSRYRVPLVLAISVLTFLFAVQIPKNEIEHNYLRLGPQETVSYETQYKVMDKFDLTPLPVMNSFGSIEEARQLTEQLKEEPLIAEVSSVSRFIRPVEDQKRNLDLIKTMRSSGQRYRMFDYTEEDMEELLYEIQRLEWNIIEIGDIAVASLGEGNKIQQKRDDMIHEVLGAEVGKPGREVFQNLIGTINQDLFLSAKRVTELDRIFAPTMARIAERLHSPKRVMTVEDIPNELAGSMMNEQRNRFLVTGIPTGEVGDSGVMMQFNERMKEIDPGMTSIISLSIELSKEILREIRTATIYVLIVIFGVLLVTFRNLIQALLAVITLSVSVIWMLGLFPVTGTSINFLNVMVLPLIIGIGTAFFIHIIRRYQAEKDIRLSLYYSGKGVFLSALTTMIGFGSLGLMASYKGIEYLGKMFFIGVFSCLVMSFFLLPALISFYKATDKKSRKTLLSEEKK
jgi:hypothetical protein